MGEHGETEHSRAERASHDPVAAGSSSARLEKVRTTGILILATLAVVAALYFGSEFLVPIALAITFSILLRPMVRHLERVRVPPAVGAAIVVIGLLAVTLELGFALAGPVRTWVARMPQNFAAAEGRLSRPIHTLRHAATTVSHAMQGPATEPAQEVPQASSTVSDLQNAAMHVVGTTTRVIGEGVGVVLLLYLMLASGDLFARKLVRVLDRTPDKRFAVESVHETEAVVHRYVTVAALIFLAQGAVVALAMWLIGMPSPLLWGIFTFVLEFIPYLGAAVMVVLLSVTALATFDSIGHILLAPAAYLLISTIQASVVSPVTYGRQLKLNPVVVLVGVLFWWFVWGVPGAFLAVPILATAKAISERTSSLRPLGEFLGE